jgi:hypothetical protein
MKSKSRTRRQSRTIKPFVFNLKDAEVLAKVESEIRNSIRNKRSFEKVPSIGSLGTLKRAEENLESPKPSPVLHTERSNTYLTT